MVQKCSEATNEGAVMSGGHGPHRIKVMNIKDFKRVLRSPDVDYDGIVSLTGQVTKISVVGETLCFIGLSEDGTEVDVVLREGLFMLFAAELKMEARLCCVGKPGVIADLVATTVEVLPKETAAPVKITSPCTSSSCLPRLKLSPMAAVSKTLEELFHSPEGAETYSYPRSPPACSEPVCSEEEPMREIASGHSDVNVMENLILMVETLSKMRSGVLPCPPSANPEILQDPGPSWETRNFHDAERNKRSYKRSSTSNDNSSSDGIKCTRIDNSVEEEEHQSWTEQDGPMENRDLSQICESLYILSGKVTLQPMKSADFQSLASSCGLDAVVVYKSTLDKKRKPITMCSVLLNSVHIATGTSNNIVWRDLTWQACYNNVFTILSTKSPQEILESHEHVPLSTFSADADFIESPTLHMDSNMRFMKRHGDGKSKALSDFIIMETQFKGYKKMLEASSRYSVMLLRFVTRPFNESRRCQVFLEKHLIGVGHGKNYALAEEHASKDALAKLRLTNDVIQKMGTDLHPPVRLQVSQCGACPSRTSQPHFEQNLSQIMSHFFKESEFDSKLAINMDELSVWGQASVKNVVSEEGFKGHLRKENNVNLFIVSQMMDVKTIVEYLEKNGHEAGVYRLIKPSEVMTGLSRVPRGASQPPSIENSHAVLLHRSQVRVPVTVDMMHDEEVVRVTKSKRMQISTKRGTVRNQTEWGMLHERRRWKRKLTSINKGSVQVYKYKW